MKTKKTKLPPIARDTSEPRCLFQQLCAHTLSDILPKKDLKLLKKYSGKSKCKPDFFRSKKPLQKTEGSNPVYLLLETGAYFSEEYQEKTIAHFQSLGFSKTFLEILKAAQNQMVEPLLLSADGCFAEPRTPPQIQPDLHNNPPSNLTAFLKDLQHFHSNYPVELLTNILTHHQKTPKKSPAT
jgi:hypothetical protein